VELHEAWFEIARRIYIGDETWICNAAARLPISYATYNKILVRVAVERRRQRGSSSLWRHLRVDGATGRAARIRFIAAELRRLAGA
jgi:hypothetical protein